MCDSGANEVYETPKTLDEALLALQMRSILERSVENQLQHMQDLSQAKEIHLNILGFPMDFGFLFGSVVQLARRNVMLALQMKVKMSAITLKVEKLALVEFIDKYCLADPGAVTNIVNSYKRTTTLYRKPTLSATFFRRTLSIDFFAIWLLKPPS
jgi:hypothetical protein